MQQRRMGIGLLTTGAFALGIVMVMVMTPVGAAFSGNLGLGGPVTSSSPSLSLKYRSVAVGGDCNDYGQGAPCNPCELSGSMTNSHGKTVEAVCSDVLSAAGAKQTWHAYYYFSGKLDSGGVNINETSGTLYAGQSLQFIFGLQYGCAVPYNPDIVKIVGPDNTVEIGFGGCG
jgi:hypothetical protein